MARGCATSKGVTIHRAIHSVSCHNSLSHPNGIPKPFTSTYICTPLCTINPRANTITLLAPNILYLGFSTHQYSYSCANSKGGPSAVTAR